MPQTKFSEVTWVLCVKVDPVVMRDTSITLASHMHPVLANVAVALVVPKFPGCPQSAWHVGSPDKRATLFFKRKTVSRFNKW